MHGTLQFHEHGIGAAKQLDNNNIRKSLTNVENVKKKYKVMTYLT